MTTEEVTACVGALGMFGDYTSFDIDKVKKALDDMSISSEKSNKSTLSLQGLKNTLSDLGYEGYEAYQILEKLRSEEDIKLLDFDVTSSEQVVNLINKLKELEAIHIDPSGAINTSSLVQELSALGMTSEQISTFISQINELTSYHFDGSNFEDLQSIQTYVDGVLGNDDKSSIESMNSLKESEDEAKKSAENLEEAIEGVNNVSVSTVTDGVSDLSDKLDKANNMAVTLKDNLDKLNLDNSGSSTGSSEHSNVTPTPTPQATGTFAYANGSKVSLNKDQEALVNELGEESIVRDGELHVIPGGAHIEKLKKGDIIFNHKQTKELKKHGRVTTNNGRGKVIGAFKSGTVPAFPSGTVSGKNPATGKKWSTSKDDEKDKNTSADTTKFQEAIDWCAQTIGKLTSVIDKINAKLSLTNSSLKTQIKNYKELLNKQQSLIKGYSKSETVYKKEYNKALKKLSKSDQKKVKDGTYRIEQFSGKAKSGSTSKAETRYNNIQKALEARDTYLESQTNTINAKQDFQEYAEALASIRWEDATEKVEKLNSKVSVLDTKMSNVSGYKAKNKVLQEQLDLQEKILTKQEKAYENTQSDANAYYKKISSKYKKNKNKDGTIKTKGVTDQAQLKYIKIYNAYVKQLAEDSIKLAQAEEDYKASVKEASITRVENIKADYDNKLALIDAKANELDNQIALAEAKGQVASVEYYKQLGENSDQRMNELKGEKKALEGQLSTLTPYSDAWYEVKQSVIEVDEAIADETLNAVENINKQIEAMKELTQAKNDYLSGTVGTLNWLEGLTDEEDYYNEDGGFSDKGLAVAKGKLTKAGLYEQQAKNIQENLEELDKMYANGNSDMSEATYLKQKMELTKDYQDVMTSWYDEQQSLHDMYINNLKKESEALSELIDKKKESWEADKSEYDYKKSISEKTKNITDLEKQKSMLEGSTSEEDKAKLQKINVELEDAQQDLEDTQYEKQLERMEEGLDGLQERFDAIIDKLDEEGAIPSVEEIATIVSKNETNVEDGIKQIIKDAGLDSLLGEKGFEGLNSKANELLTTSTTSITSVIETTNSWLEKIFNKDVGNNGNNGSNSNNSSTSSTTTNTEKNSGTSLFDVVKKQTSSIVQKKVKEFIDSNATKAKKKKTEYGILNQKIYEITNGKILNKANRVKLAKSLGVNDTDGNGDITGVEAQKVVKLLENAGFSSGGIVKAVHKNGDDGLATLKAGEAVLTPVQTDAFLKLADNFTPLNSFMDIIQKPKLPAISKEFGASTTIDNVSFEFNLPNVVDSDSLIKTIQTDSRVQRTLQNATVGKLNGNTKFGVNRL